MRSTFKILFYLKRDKQKADGMIPLYCRITTYFLNLYYLCSQYDRKMNKNVKLENWQAAQKRHRLSDKQVRMGMVM
jgi:hypothetical protein